MHPSLSGMSRLSYRRLLLGAEAEAMLRRPRLGGPMHVSRPLSPPVPIELPLTGVTGASLIGLVEVDMQLLFTLRRIAQPDTSVSGARVWPSSDAYENPFVVLSVAASSSTARPSSDAGRAALKEKFKRAVGAIFFNLDGGFP